MADGAAEQASTSRSDGRGPDEFRSVFINTKVVSQAKGSAYAEFNNTKIMAGVYGPRQGEGRQGFRDTGRLQCDVRLTTFAAQGLGKQAQSSIEREMSAALHQALSSSVLLDKYPKAVIDVFVMVLESGGSDLAAAVCAASVALADAGIEVWDLVPACQVVKSTGRLLLDPTRAEEVGQEGGVLLALMPSHNQVTQLVLTGTWSPSESQEALALCMGGCMQLRAAMREALLAGTG
mmetsp:Transcript_27910/g.61247  ORF Transcript_27910/g.61247 Transcript_27910/m.61247 type:complete len:235 (+) Transcript_27910:128-832(+)|eukprot:CAMPEP_0202890446 /NCGR_PEP_ID=MMETSP1392-20130828/844_1 /ASSEMBLY_ACC=CAM_ASM_000868 /TAXON_ID=225041 /ORGANISM="Chlamydomonas chlamydogama, Strain SAG 11-48b" /LENGTH=234 /DNA_ID=CAMNT_0049574015 /DNA_START=104 /DNA_END=811 /DNA_ORIENTATION=-